MFIGKRIIVVAALAALVTTCFAQRGGFGRGPQMGAFLLRRPDVQNDLKLTDDQKTKLLDMQDSLGSRFGELRGETDPDKRAAAMKAISDDANKQVNAILTADQQVRLKQIGIQLAGNGAAAMPDVQADLKLTDDQKAKIADLSKTAGDANRSVFQKMQSQEIDRDTGMATVKKNNDALNDAIGKILTDDQKAQLKKMAGPTFTPDPPPGG